MTVSFFSIKKILNVDKKYLQKVHIIRWHRSAWWLNE